MSLIDLVYAPVLEHWTEQAKTAFQRLYGAPQGRYPSRASGSVSLRAPSPEIPFASLIHPSNPESGPYAGMSFVIFPVANAQSLVAMVVGTQGLSPDEEILGRPGHGRKVQAICAWLNRRHGNYVAWAKQDPVRIDLDLPGEVRRQFPQYEPAFRKYGKVIYGFFAPTDDRAATEDGLNALLDLTFEERGIEPLMTAKENADKLRGQYFAHFFHDVSQAEIAALLERRRYVILQGPPGTGKTRMAQELLANTYENWGSSIQFHPNTTYETFVGGLAPVSSERGMGFSFAPKPGTLMQAVEAASRQPHRPYLLHIDEINRADLSKVLGEAIYLLEAQPERPRQIALSYDFGPPLGDRLQLPENLHILGTMNTADRSIAIVDVAVRRRFGFVSMWPQIDVVQVGGGSLMQEAFQRLLSLFIEYATPEALNLVPGHSYFLVRDNAEAARSLRVNLIPLLNEYLAEGHVAGFSDSIRAYLQWLDGKTHGA
jgi:5-methylcytosine-specific restriction protein B